MKIDRYKQGYVCDEWGMNSHLGLIKDSEGSICKFSDVQKLIEATLWQPIDTAPDSNRAKDFQEFSKLVINHIDKYTVPQYGDSPDDLVEEWTVQQCVDSAKKYLARHGRNQREGQDELDLIKAAHYIQIAYTKLKK